MGVKAKLQKNWAVNVGGATCTLLAGRGERGGDRGGAVVNSIFFEEFWVIAAGLFWGVRAGKADVT